ncbi:MAG TPA: 2-oxo-4-hydroxy-4-carboxy-5-ureidoimidazoline decarboxylase, partial [Terrimicrobiaceae bacterium]|nr:2-oxo-4-hydroxy-4-carboxy-5-ureidoimidazoline decarboxylase [Terrimicrobiaceae bacterium]
MLIFPFLPFVKALDNGTLTRHHDALRMSGITSRKCTMAELNALPARGFAAVLGGVFEHSAWIPEAAAEKRPFANREELLAAMTGIIAASGEESQLALIRAHP